ncbi:MAG: helix-turn-helix domain-containing protein [Sedimenticola sp.]|nr:helix-turn-helix domain-containing protein [Sedimenticola sp.]
MELDLTTCEQARQTRDSRFDGRFFVGVRSTGIYCRPVCPARLPKAENVTFYPTAAAAAEAGYRPCLRCRPETAPGTPAWMGTSTTVNRALRLIHEGSLDQATIPALADRLGITSRHLGRLFRKHLGASPKAIALTRRLQFAKKLIDQTSLSMTEIALAAGYGSLRRFNDHFQQVYGRAPSTLRRSDFSASAGGLTLPLPLRPPYDWSGVCEFLARRAIPGVEWVEAQTWHRRIKVNDEVGTVSVSRGGDDHLLCQLDIPATGSLIGLVERVRRLFDLDADPAEITAILSRDPVLNARLEDTPGVRVPGAWDGFELAIRAIVGQQISVDGATTIMGRIAKACGSHQDGIALFPTPQQLMAIDPALLPMPRTRAGAIMALSKAVAEGEIDLGRWVDADELKRSLLAIKGIGEWTADYIALRVLSDPDAFLHGDLVLKKVANRLYGDTDGEALRQRSHAWRPWRAYAGILLWRAAAETDGRK